MDGSVLGGALIGGGTGALIGGLAGHTAGAAVAGALIGAAAGAIIADATRPGWCYYWRITAPLITAATMFVADFGLKTGSASVGVSAITYQDKASAT